MSESDVVALTAEVERLTGGRVSFGYPVTTRFNGWRATIHGGAVGLASVTLRPPCTQADALRALIESIATRSLPAPPADD